MQDLTLEIADGELMVLVGPSGCGKTTALRMVAGLEQISEGEVRIGDEVVNGLPPRDRDVAMVFQNYALYPHKSIYENLAFPLRLRKLSQVARSTSVSGAWRASSSSTSSCRGGRGSSREGSASGSPWGGR